MTLGKDGRVAPPSRRDCPRELTRTAVASTSRLIRLGCVNRDDPRPVDQSVTERTPHHRFLHLENQIHHRLVLHGISALRIAVGLVFLGFGVLKYFPGVSPAENLTKATTHLLFLGLVPGDVAVVIVATLECFIGICLLANRGMRIAIWLLGFEFVGILAPAFLLPGRLFAGPHHAPTLEGQYVLKDIILVAAGIVIAAGSFRGGRLVRGDLAPAAPAAGPPLDADEKLGRPRRNGGRDPSRGALRPPPDPRS